MNKRNYFEQASKFLLAKANFRRWVFISKEAGVSRTTLHRIANMEGDPGITKVEKVLKYADEQNWEEPETETE